MAIFHSYVKLRVPEGKVFHVQNSHHDFGTSLDAIFHQPQQQLWVGGRGGTPAANGRNTFTQNGCPKTEGYRRMAILMGKIGQIHM